MTYLHFALMILLCAGTQTAIGEPSWKEGTPIARDGRANPFELPAEQLKASERQGRLHALHYPVEVSGILLPYQPIQRFMSSDMQNPLRYVLSQLVAQVDQFHSFNDFEAWLGLPSYPLQEGEGPYFVPFAAGTRPDNHMGLTRLQTPYGEAFTISCAQCHSENLFGRRIMGLTNRFPRANSFFVRGLEVAPYVTADFFQWATHATRGETHLFASSMQALDFVEAKRPVQLGLDTSLAQVALSLARRAPDGWASRDVIQAPRDEPLAEHVADSKPAVWWNVKYKNRWLSDGSLVSGNPILTNFIWNELGRGTDLHKLNQWFQENTTVIRDLTTAVFSAEAPRWTDFFPADQIEERRARRGEIVYLKYCSRCHGTYEKAWSASGAMALDWSQRMRTTHVQYASQTRVVDVGTDPGRFQGMTSLAQLNNLEVSRRFGIRIQPQKGYVPPPLVGIWARWPYFHNNSVRSLCEVLLPTKERALTYWARKADHPERDFDRECNGYPQTKPLASAPREWFYDTRKEGLHRDGHDEGIFLKEGRDLLTNENRKDLIQFLQTL